MKIKYTVGKKSLEVDYFPREKGEYLSREEDYIFDAALQLEIRKIYSTHKELFVAVEGGDTKGVEEYQFRRFPKDLKQAESELQKIHKRAEKLIQLYVVTQEYIGCMKESLERLYESHREAIDKYYSLSQEQQTSFNEFRIQLIAFVERVELLLSERKSLDNPIENWDAGVPVYMDIPYVNIGKLTEIVNDIQEMVRGDYERKGKYEKDLSNADRKNFIRNKLRQLPRIFTEEVSADPQRLREAKKAIFGRDISEVETIKMMISAEVFEEKADEIENFYQTRINESADCPSFYEDLEDEPAYIELIRKLEDNIHGFILMNKKEEDYFVKTRCVALFDLDETKRLFSLSGTEEYNGTCNNQYIHYPPAIKVYDILSEDTEHEYIWCGLVPNVKRYAHWDNSTKSTQPLQGGHQFEELSELGIGVQIPYEYRRDFSCCERKIFAYFEDDISRCMPSPSLIARWSPCELCKPAINALQDRGVSVKCFYIWKTPKEYANYLTECRKHEA